MIIKNFDINEILKFSLFNEKGTEGILFDYDNKHLLKKYYNISLYSEDELKEIIYAQKYIHKTTLPLGIGYFNGIFVGPILKKFLDAQNFSKINTLYSFEYLLLKLKELLEYMQELTDNGLFPVDIDTENVLLVKNKVEIIDLDGRGLIIDKKDNMELLNDCLRLYKNIVIETLFPDETINIYNNKIILSPTSNQDLLNYIMTNNISYDAYYEILKVLSCDQKYLERGHAYVKS